MSQVHNFQPPHQAQESMRPKPALAPRPMPAPPGPPKLPPMVDMEADLRAAQELHADARRRADVVKTRLDAATAAYTEAADTRARLVSEAARGVEIASKAHASTETAIKIAENDKRLWEEAYAEASNAVTAAEAPVLEAQKQIAKRRLADAALHRIQAAMALDKAAAEFGAKYSAWRAAGEGIEAERGLIAYQQHELENIRDYRHGLWTLPSAILGALISFPNGTSAPIAGRDRNAWGQLAALVE